MATFQPLGAPDISTLEQQGCSAADWSSVHVAKGFDASRVHRTQFTGTIRLGSLSGTVEVEGGVEIETGIRDVHLIDCEIGDDVLISRVGGHIARMKIGRGTLITDVGTIATNPGASFGNGVEAETINEGGGREIGLFAELSSQFAYLLAMHRHRSDVIGNLQKMVTDYTQAARSDVGVIGAGARISHVGEIIDVQIGDAAQVVGATRLHNGTILSEPDAATTVGGAVVAEDFIIAEGAEVVDGVVLHSCFVGQGSKMGKQFSAENSLFFANCEGFHGEACSIFAGPYTVTHHKSTLLIAGIYSFYNAGSGTNQSNHMYKLGPVHQGVVQRGSKNGSFSYMRWPTVVGPFSVVIGKHLNNFDIGDLPFSYVTEEEGEPLLTPAMNMFTVGTVRDGEKWPTRDRRTASTKRDQICFDVYSPYTVGKMVRAQAALTSLYEDTPRDVEQLRYKGVLVKRLMLRKGARNYRDGIDVYLQGKILERAAEARSASDQGALRSALATGDGIGTGDWSDVGGQLIPQARLAQIEDGIATGKLSTPADVDAAFATAATAYAQDEWAWICRVWTEREGAAPEELSLDQLAKIEVSHRKMANSTIKKILADAEKEFDPVARYGYGAEGNDEARDTDFEAVRGTFADNSFIQQMQDRLSDG
ncbi:MAG: DUF4954 family protein [Gemmatimonadetes bacterium]|mgnify:CR=1 FL=1|jgi:hypothetical protein|nr:DUF4954 family protein [Gemmatimonadota bacterium]MBT6149502.1 DUF4954 family protein [Gemmatimonadota bacterium]MBT7863589.1 DUF4954 family protein [Gemmatimonadota bacterium]